MVPLMFGQAYARDCMALVAFHLEKCNLPILDLAVRQAEALSHLFGLILARCEDQERWKKERNDDESGLFHGFWGWIRLSSDHAVTNTIAARLDLDMRWNHRSLRVLSAMWGTQLP